MRIAGKTFLVAALAVAVALGAGYGLRRARCPTVPPAPASSRSAGPKPTSAPQAKTADHTSPRASPVVTLDRHVLEASLEAGKAFLLNNQTEAGNFHYSFDFVAGRNIDADSEVRQAGALWGLALIHRFQPAADSREGVRRGLQFFASRSRSLPDGREFPVYPDAGQARTGTLAFNVLVLVDFLRAEKDRLRDSDRQGYTAYLDGCIRTLRALRRDDGHFAGAFALDTGDPMSPPSPYFDGESLLALVRAARYLGYNDLEPLVKESADAMYRTYVMQARSRKPDNALTKAFYQWGTMALYELYTSGWTHVEHYAPWGVELGHWMIDVHRTLGRRRNTAYAYEGLITARELARLSGDTLSQRKFEYVISQGLGRLITWQVGGPRPDAYLLAHPAEDARAVGGVMNHAAEPELRIDVTQHQMHAIILALRYLLPEP